MQTRDEKLLKLAYQCQSAKNKQKKLIRGKAWKIITENTDNNELRDELIEEWEEIAYK